MSERRLRLELRPSRRFAAVIVLLHAAAGAGAALSLPAAPGAGLACALALLGILAARRAALLAAPSSVRRIELEGERALITLAGGAQLEAPVAPRRYVGSLFVAITLRRPAGRTLLVTADMLRPDSFRSLRVWALWGKLPAVAAKQPAA